MIHATCPLCVLRGAYYIAPSICKIINRSDGASGTLDGFTKVPCSITQRPKRFHRNGWGRPESGSCVVSSLNPARDWKQVQANISGSLCGGNHLTSNPSPDST
jgi:hypothetical protein